MATSKGKEKLKVAPEYGVEVTSDGTTFTELLRTPEPFSMDIREDVEREIERLESLAAEYHELNSNERFRVRFGRLITQRDQLRIPPSATEMDIQSDNPGTLLSGTAGQESSVDLIHTKVTIEAEERQQSPMKTTEPTDDEPDLKILSDNDILLLAQQPPKVRKRYSRYWNRNGKIREPYFAVIFKRTAKGELVLPEKSLASNVENWRVRLRQFDHPEFYNAQTRLPPTPSNRLEYAESEVLRLQEMIHDSDSLYREEVMKVEQT